MLARNPLPASDAWHSAMEGFVGGGGRFSEATRRTYRGVLRKFAAFAVEQDPRYAEPGEVDLVLLEHYGRALDEWNPAPRTRSLHISAVRRFIEWSRAHDVSMPARRRVAEILPTHGPRPDEPVVAPPRRDMASMLDHVERIEPRDRAVWLLAAVAGLRPSEIGAVRCSDIRRSPKGGLVLVVRGERVDDRVVPMVRDLETAVVEYLRETGRRLGTDDYLFEATDRAAAKRGSVGLTRRTIHRIVQRVGRELDLDVTPRDLRHAFAVQFLGAGGGAVDLQAILGHASLVSTTKYLASLRLAESRETIERQVDAMRRLATDPSEGDGETDPI